MSLYKPTVHKQLHIKHSLQDFKEVEVHVVNQEFQVAQDLKDTQETMENVFSIVKTGPTIQNVSYDHYYFRIYYCIGHVCVHLIML